MVSLLICYYSALFLLEAMFFLASLRAFALALSFLKSGRSAKNSTARITSVGSAETRNTSRFLKKRPTPLSESVNAFSSRWP